MSSPPVEGQQGSTTKKELGPPAGFAAELFEAFSSIFTLARTINCSVDVPEVLFVGKQSHGKSVLLEGFLGHKIFDSSTSTKRPCEIRLINNPSCDTPLVTLLRDTADKDASQQGDVEVPYLKLADAIKERCAIKTTVPVRVVYQFKYCWNMTLIDTPAILSGDSSVDVTVAEMARPEAGRRILVAVEEVADVDQLDMPDWLTRADPRCERSVLVLNKFQPWARNTPGPHELAVWMKQLNQLPQWPRVFLTTSPGDGGRPENSALYRRRIAALLKADVEVLEQLQYNRSKWDSKVGSAALQKCVLEICWRRYQDNAVPAVLRRLRELRKSAQDSRSMAAMQLSAAEQTRDLRHTASTHASSFLTVVSSFLAGSIDGRPALNGQTLEEEKQAVCASWPIEISTEALSAVPGSDSRLYGAQQFERLMAEFRSVVTASSAARIGVLELSEDELATALGSSRAGSATDIAWASADLAQTKSRALLLPLVHQLVERGKYILKRVVSEVTDHIPGHGWTTTTETKSPASKLGMASAGGLFAGPSAGVPKGIEMYPHFTMLVKELYYKMVDDFASQTLTQCNKEFHETKMVYWDLSNNHGALLESAKELGSPLEAVREVTKEMFDVIRMRTLENVMMRCYETMLVALQSRMQQVIHGKIAQLSDVELAELFESNSTKQRLTAEVTYWDQILAEFQVQEAAFLKSASTFAHSGAL